MKRNDCLLYDDPVCGKIRCMACNITAPIRTETEGDITRVFLDRLAENSTDVPFLSIFPNGDFMAHCIGGFMPISMYRLAIKGSRHRLNYDRFGTWCVDTYIPENMSLCFPFELNIRYSASQGAEALGPISDRIRDRSIYLPRLLRHVDTALRQHTSWLLSWRLQTRKAMNNTNEPSLSDVLGLLTDYNEVKRRKTTAGWLLNDLARRTNIDVLSYDSRSRYYFSS